jgi:hypothetical protein
VIEESSYKADNSLNKKINYSYEYDSQNNWIKKTIKIDNETVNIIERQIEYFK